MVVDGLLVSVGSTNFDNRSFRLNDEANLNVYDAGFAERQTDLRGRPGALAARHLQEWKNRPRSERVRERAASLLGSQM